MGRGTVLCRPWADKGPPGPGSHRLGSLHCPGGRPGQWHEAVCSLASSGRGFSLWAGAVRRWEPVVAPPGYSGGVGVASISLSTYLSVYLQARKRSYSARFPHLDNSTNAAILRDFLNFWTWQTQEFCQTSSIFEVDSIKNEAILRDFLQKWTVECRADGLVPMSFAIFPVQVSQVLRVPWKSDARSYEVLHLSRKITLANLKIWCSKMQTILRNQRPDLLTSLMNMSLVLRLPREMHLSRSFKCPTPAIVFGNATKPSRFAHLWQGAESLAPATRNHIWTFKSGPGMWCF